MSEIDAAPSTTMTPAERRRRLIQPILIGLLAVALNIAAYYLIPAHFVRRLGAFGYLGVFVVTFVANATVVVPVPYFGLVARLAQELHPLGVVLAGALGSVLGESVAFFVGRSGRGVIEDTRFYRWVHIQMRHPWRAFVLLFLLAAPPNPAFDVAGLAAGALGLPYWLFFTAVFLGRIIRIGLIALVGAQINSPGV
jgi:membrane protein YqaA with SNARE-associated domain